MKIICVDQNYLTPEAPEPDTTDPILYLKPETALTRSDWPFFVPDWSQQIEFQVELVVRLCKLGKSIPERFAHRYYDEITLGVNFTARDVLNDRIAKGLPWEIATGFDGSAYCGQQWLRLSELGKSPQDLHFDIQFNGTPLLSVSTAQMRHTIDHLISYASRYYLLKTGDLLFTGAPTPCGVVQEGSLITATLDSHPLLSCHCK